MSVVIHSSNKWAAEHFETDSDWIIDVLLSSGSNVAGGKLSKPDHVDLHRWRYANSQARDAEEVFVDPKMRVAACGDWSIKGVVEAAYLSGKATSARVSSILQASQRSK